jgi:hypothetical protein
VGKIVHGMQKEMLEREFFRMMSLLAATVAKIAQKFRTAIRTDRRTNRLCRERWLPHRHDSPPSGQSEAKVYSGNQPALQIWEKQTYKSNHTIRAQETP